MAKKKIEVKGLEIRLESFNADDYVSLTDIAKQKDDVNSKYIIISWLKNGNTLSFIEEWELMHNPNFKVDKMVNFKNWNSENGSVPTSQKLIKETNAIGIVSKSGRYGGTFAHKDIALEFCSWLSPRFKVHLIKAFQKLMVEEFNRRNLEWHISKITDNIEEVRNLLDTIPGQTETRNRLKNGDK